MNKRQRKKRLRKQGYIIGIDLSGLPDQIAYMLPYTVIHHICSKIINDINNFKWIDAVKHRSIQGEGSKITKGIISVRKE